MTSSLKNCSPGSIRRVIIVCAWLMWLTALFLPTHQLNATEELARGIDGFWLAAVSAMTFFVPGWPAFFVNVPLLLSLPDIFQQNPEPGSFAFRTAFGGSMLAITLLMYGPHLAWGGWVWVAAIVFIALVPLVDCWAPTTENCTRNR